MSKPSPENSEVAAVLERAAELLELQDANPFRVRSYRRAADAIRSSDPPVAKQFREGGVAALEEIPGIGEKLAGSIQEIVDTGRLGLVDDLEAETSPETLLTQVPGVGEKLAARIHEKLGVSSLEELEMAAHDGRLAEVEGLGEERVDGIRDALAGMLTRSARRRARQRQEASGGQSSDAHDPPVEVLLDVDEEYRAKADAGELRTIAPRRFNPENEEWLPIMETKRDGWEFTVLFSNTAKAHELGKTWDWVVIYYQKDDGEEDQCTVLTAGSGPLKGRRMVAGREQDCREYYQ